MSRKNTYLQLPQVSHSSVVGYNGVPAHQESLFHHHPDVFAAGHYVAASAGNAPPLIDAAAYFNQDINGLNGNLTPAMVNTFQKKQTAKKDRHSKIYTSLGPRDRRVRLSIGIARKFFDLQEMLGFDKPSKTLDWLLTKSKAAIKELVQMKGKSVSSPSGSDVLSAEAFESDAKRKGKDVAKESRAKARARARERTREKMCIKQLSNGVRSTAADSIPVPYSVICPVTNEIGFSDQNLIQESVVIKRKNVFVSRDFSSNYDVPSDNSAAENWDICAILDQHKFINSTSNI